MLALAETRDMALPNSDALGIAVAASARVLAYSCVSFTGAGCGCKEGLHVHSTRLMAQIQNRSLDIPF